MISKYTPYILFLLLFLFSCGKTDQTYTIEMKDGVKYVHNCAPLWGDEPKVALEFVKKIGGLDIEDENYQLYKPCDVDCDAYGNVYVLDAGNYRVQKYDVKGNFLLSMGRRGQGPGELENPRYLQIDSDGRIHVVDWSNHRVEVFETNGKALYSYRANERYFAFKLLNNGDTVVDITQSSYAKAQYPDDWKDLDLPLVHIYDLHGNVKRGIGKERIYKDMTMTQIGNWVFIAVDKNDNIFLAFGHQNRIEKYLLDGKLLLNISRALNYKESTTHESVEVMYKGLEISIANVNIFSIGIYIDSQGRIWVPTHLRQLNPDEMGPEGEKDSPDLINFEVYNSEGVLLTKIPWEFGIACRLRCIHGDRLYFTDSEYEMCVYKYKIVEK